MRSHEQPLKQQAVVAERGAALPADAGSCKAHRGALDKLDEETQELRSAVENGTNFEEELGDVLFAAVKVGRFCGVDPEAALSKTCEKFIARFRKVEETVNARGEDMSALPLDELMALWNDAKEQLR